MAVKTTYRVESLEGLAELFDERAASAKGCAASANTLRDRRLWLKEAETWTCAAKFARATTIEPKAAGEQT